MIAILDSIRGLHTWGTLLLAAGCAVPLGCIAIVVASTVGYLQQCRQSAVTSRSTLQAVCVPIDRRRG